MRHRSVVRALVLTTVLSLAASACGDSGSDETGGAAPTTGATAATTTTTLAPKTGGSITMGLAVNSAGGGTISASRAFPGRWRVLTHAAATVS